MYLSKETRIWLVLLISVIRDGSGTIAPYKWMYRKPYGTTVNLEPLFNDTRCLAESRCYWLLPDKHTRIEYPVNASAGSKYSISPSGVLTIVNIQADNNGIYHFFKMNHSQWIVSKAMLNVHGAPFDSLWLEYWPNVVGGLVAMAVVFITFGLILLADKYRYRPPASVPTRRLSEPPRTTNPVFIARANSGFIDDEVDALANRQRRQSNRSSTTSNATNLRMEQL